METLKVDPDNKLPIFYNTFDHSFGKKNTGNLFPYLKDKKRINDLKIDSESIYFISMRQYSFKITNIIIYHLNELKLNPSNISITDGTAGVGGDTISFCKYFHHVNAVELDKKRCEYLDNNLNIYDLNNFTIHNGDCTELIPSLEQHVVYLDPPWMGRSYKLYTDLLLKIGKYPIEEFCNMLMDNKLEKNIPSLIILKLPTNYNIKHFYESINKKHSIYLHDIKKMYIIVIVVNKTNIE